MSFKANNIDVSRDFCHALYHHYSSSDAYRIYPDVHPCLQKLSSAGVTLGVLSDFDIRLQSILDGFGISSYFKFVIQSLVEGYSKPSEELWAAALERGGVAVEEGYHVGDDPAKDAFMEAKTIILDRDSSITTTAFPRIQTLEELPDLLKLY